MAKRRTDEQLIEYHKEQVRKLQRKVKEASRRNREHALIVMGGLINTHIDWQDVDLDALSRFLILHDAELRACTAGHLEADEAAERVKAWERKVRDAHKADLR